MINYSIIIPHKNSPELLAYCLSTIPIRDDVQVIVVDDNSEESKVDFEHFPKWKGMRYEYYLTKEGKGAGYARNVGLNYAKGKWVLFVDADDYVLPIIDDIFNESVNSEADIIFFRPTAVMLEDRTMFSSRAIGCNRLIDNYLLTKDENNIRCHFFNPVSKFVRRDLIERNNIRFEEIKYSNDVSFSVKVGCLARIIDVKEDTYYVITESENSLHSKFNNKPGELLIRSGAFFRAAEYISEHGYQFNFEEAKYYLSQLIIEDRQMFAKHIRWLASQMKMSTLSLLCDMLKYNSLISKFKRLLLGGWALIKYNTLRSNE